MNRRAYPPHCTTPRHEVHGQTVIFRAQCLATMRFNSQTKIVSSIGLAK
ncbi:MAG: hypothetical protein ACYDBJ_14220 [Aggregatilineales bacterium]